MYVFTWGETFNSSWNLILKQHQQDLGLLSATVIRQAQINQCIFFLRCHSAAKCSGILLERKMVTNKYLNKQFLTVVESSKPSLLLASSFWNSWQSCLLSEKINVWWFSIQLRFSFKHVEVVLWYLMASISLVCVCFCVCAHPLLQVNLPQLSLAWDAWRACRATSTNKKGPPPYLALLPTACGKNSAANA